MNIKLFVVCTLVVVGCLLPEVQGVNLLTIDTFQTGGSASQIIYTIPAGVADGVWYSPYYPDVNPPQVKYVTTTDAVGGQRDLVLGYVGGIPEGSTAIVQVVQTRRTASISFPLDWVGGAYFQWDGVDNVGTSPDPGASLNPNLPSPIDITFNGQAQGITLSATSDQDTDYRLSVINSGGLRNTYQFILQANEPNFDFIPIYYTDPGWTVAGYDFTDVRGFEIQIQTGTVTASNAPDTQFTAAFIFSYAIDGTAFVRCNCLTTAVDQLISGLVVDLKNAAGTTTLDSTTTDVNGDYTFWALNPATYQVCLRDTTQLLCSSSPRCQSVTINPATPAASYQIDFVVTRTTTFSIPPNVNGDCSDCKFPDGTANCPGYAQTTGCLGTTTQVTTYTDVITGDSCQLNIQRTWTSPDDGTVLTQRLTYRDTTAPSFDTLPQNLSQECDAAATTLTQWVTADAFSTNSDDCSDTFVTNNWNTLPVGPCNSVTVAFTVHDECGQTSAPASATYTLTDTSDPIIDTDAQDQTVECSAKTTSVQTALTNWLNNRANAAAHDTCTTISWTNDSGSQVPLNPRSCFDDITVTFTAHDQCSNTAATTATFTVQDTTSAVFTRNPQNLIRECTGDAGDQTAFDNWLNTAGGAIYTDSCSTNDLDIVLSDDYTTTTLDVCGDSVVVNFSIQDACGNPPSFAAATFFIQDSASPFFTTFAQDQSVECDGAGNQDDFDSWILDNGGARATDDCTTVSWTNDNTGAPVPGCNSNVVVTFTASDDCGRIINDQAVFTIRDTTAPSFDVAPGDTSSECNANAAADYAAWIGSNAGASASDLCDALVTITNNGPANPLLGCNRDTVVSFFAQDSCLNTSPANVATFTVVDTEDPFITNPGTPLSLECNRATNQADFNNWLAVHANADAADDCSPSLTWTNNGAQTLVPTCVFTQNVDFTATDACGRSVVTTQSVSIIDNVPPVLVNPAVDQDIQCDTIHVPSSTDQYNSWVALNGFATATDDCTTVVWTNDAVGLVGADSCFASETVTFVASDACLGHSVITTATFVVRDTQPPVLITPAQVTTVECDPSSNGNAFLNWVNNHGLAVIQDACSALTWTPVVTHTPVGCDSASVTFTADDGCGSQVVTTGTFTIIDTLAPSFNPPAQNAQVECNGAGNTADYANFLSSHGGAVASDVCATGITWTNNAIGTGPVGCGTELITFTAQDSCGQRASTTASFSIIDSFAPSIFPPAADQSAECDTNSNSIAIATWLLAHGGASATDSCYSTGSLAWSNNFVSLVPLPCGAVATVTFSVSDPCFNVARTTASFTVTDSFPPVITRPAQNLVLECDAATNNQDTLTWVNSRASASATDACSAVVWTNNFVATPDPCSGPYPVEYYATDQCGNRATTTASVTIQDTVPPEFVNFPEDVHVVCDEVTDSSVTGIPSFVDNCITADVIRTESDAVDILPFERLCPGDTVITRTWRLTDACGNIKERDQIIVVSIPQGPCIPQPCIPCEDQPLLCCASSIAPVPCNPVPCTPVDCTHASCTTVPCVPVVCSNGSPPPFQDDDDTIAPSPRPQPSECEPIYIYVFDDDDGVTSQPVYTVTFNSSASTLSYSLLFSLLIAFFILM